MIWRQWECFLAVGKYMNYSRASEALFLNQSVISYHIKNLENSMGMKLFDRSSHSVRFTPYGRELYDKISPLFEEMEAIIASYDKTSQEYHLKISSTYILNYKIFSLTFGEFKKHHPNVNIIPTQLDPGQALDALLAGTIEACFAFEEEAGRYTEFKFYPLFSIRRNGYLVPAGDSLAAAPNLCYHDLIGKTVILPEKIQAYPRLLPFHKQITKLGSKVKLLYAEDLLSAYSMAAAGLGVSPSIDYMPTQSDKVKLLYNREDQTSFSGICINAASGSLYAKELASLLASKYAED